MKTLLAAVLVLFVSLPVAAQPAGQGSGAAAAQPARREKVKQRIRALRAYTLTEQLDLDEATAAKLFPALSKFDDEFDKLLQTRADLQKRLATADTLKDPKQLDKLIDETVANQRALWDTEDKRLAQLRKILTPAQTARVLVVLPAMERRLQNQLRRAAQPGQPGQAAKPARPGVGGELTGNPFGGKRGSAAHDPDLIDSPFSDDYPTLKQDPATKKPGARPAKPCDPFDTLHGCK
jgi:hypothetical protein